MAGFNEVRTREYLTDREVNALMAAAGHTGRHGHRVRHSFSSLTVMGFASPSSWRSDGTRLIYRRGFCT